MSNEPDPTSFFAGIFFTVLVFASCVVCDAVVQSRKEGLREEGRIEALHEIHGIKEAGK